ncbi:hypothetical protein CDD83_7232 [Cordyceps sp. RAO-2017]|nr:hypothetical protein CDD83_7232 [Cordyceps sp. RAO-2017]
MAVHLQPHPADIYSRTVQALLHPFSFPRGLARPKCRLRARSLIADKPVISPHASYLSAPSVAFNADDRRDAQCRVFGPDAEASPGAAAELSPRPCAYTVPAEPRFRNDCFEVALTSAEGWGAFATRKLRRGDVILCEKPLFIADKRSLFQEFDRLGPQARRLALGLHANELAKPGTPPIQNIWETNCFTVGGQQAGLFLIASRFNHACYPANNVKFHFDAERASIVLRVRADEIPVGQELRISYGRGRHALDLYTTYGFRCRCYVCTGSDESDIVSQQW